METVTDKEIKELLEIFDKNKEENIDSFSKDYILLGGEYEHYKTKVLYVPIDFARIQIDNKWVDAVIYIAIGDNIKYVRSTEEFARKFKLTE